MLKTCRKLFRFVFGCKSTTIFWTDKIFFKKNQKKFHLSKKYKPIVCCTACCMILFTEHGFHTYHIFTQKNMFEFCHNIYKYNILYYIIL